jgi:hypothetical protein
MNRSYALRNGRQRKFNAATYSADDPPLLGNESDARGRAEEGSAALLNAMIRYYAKHHPESDLARWGRAR